MPEVVIARPREDLGTTRMDPGLPSKDPTPFGGARAVLPFQDRGASAPPPSSRAPTPLQPPVPRPPTDLGSTVAATTGVTSPVLPFGGSAIPRDVVNPPQTVWDRQRAPSAPAQQPSPLPQLTIDQYAWIVAKLRHAAPADLPRTLATLRLTTETREHLEAHWRARMAADPDLRQAFIAALGGFLKKNAP
jgi:hypothetical protein